MRAKLSQYKRLCVSPYMPGYFERISIFLFFERLHHMLSTNGGFKSWKRMRAISGLLATASKGYSMLTRVNHYSRGTKNCLKNIRVNLGLLKPYRRSIYFGAGETSEIRTEFEACARHDTGH